MEEIKELLIVALSFSFTFLGMWIRKQLINFKSRKFQLVQHTLFSSISNNIRKIKTWNIKPNRQVFIDAFIIKLKLWKEDFLILSEKLQKARLNNSNLEAIIMSCTNETIEKYTYEWKEQNIPQKVVFKINEQHNENVEYFIERIQRKSHNNNMYPAFMLKVIAIFDVLELLLSETINDLNDFVFRKHMNGYYKGVKYKGIPINDEEYEEFINK